MNDDDGGSAALSLYGQRLPVFRDSGSRTTAAEARSCKKGSGEACFSVV